MLESTGSTLAESLAPLLRRIHPDTATVNHLAVQGSDGLLGSILQFHLHKAKATGLVCESVPNYHGGDHLAKLGENRKKSFLSGVVAEVPYINLLRHSKSFAPGSPMQRQGPGGSLNIVGMHREVKEAGVT